MQVHMYVLFLLQMPAAAVMERERARSLETRSTSRFASNKKINYNSRQRISRKRTLQPDHSEKSEARPGNGTLEETVEIKSKRIAARARSGTINYA